MLPLLHEPVDSLAAQFSRAMLDAQNPKPEEIVDSLTVIAGNPNLVDTIIAGERYVLVVSWKACPDWFQISGTLDTLKYYTWVTVAPEVQRRCRGFFTDPNEKDPVMRTRKLLGLQPYTIENVFVEIWVKPDDLFRPCPDDGTADPACELNLPSTVSPEHRAWFNGTRAVQYVDCSDAAFGKNGYPWTQLGYTYDWSPTNPHHVGLSEFVIRKGSVVQYRAKPATRKYCK